MNDPWKGLEWWNPPLYPPFISVRWHAYLRSLWRLLQIDKPPPLVLHAFGSFLCNWFTRKTGRRDVDGLDIHYLLNEFEIFPNGTVTRRDQEAVFAWSHNCRENLHDAYFIKVPVV